MRSDKSLIMVHALSQGLLTAHMSGGRVPFVVRAAEPHQVVAALRTIAAAAGYSMRGYPRLPTPAEAPGLPQRHVVVRQGPVTDEVARSLVELGTAMPAETIVVVVLHTDDSASMKSLGTALLAAGLIADDGDADADVEPGQRVPSAWLA